jgi:5'-3' exonuclease
LSIHSQKVLIVDGMNLIKRCFHAIPSRKNKEGMEVNSLYGFIRTLINEQSIFSFAGIVVVFDSKTGSQYRKDIYPEYKGNRRPKTQEEADQRELVNEQVRHLISVLEFCNIPVLMHKRFEADDVIASLAQILKHSYHLFILSADKDLYQLIETNVSIIKPGMANGVKTVINPRVFKDLYPELEGPTRMFDLKVLAGDTSDNVKGLTRVGDKTALKLLEEFGTVDVIQENLDSLSPKHKLLFTNEKEILERNKKIIALVRDIPISPDKTPIGLPNFYTPKAKELYLHYNINPWES